ncbi:MAG: hypothetical protein SCALA702_08300 [Melioribacteraceae bacterium]|nr:MAG: hypothetical protein SCALA702_08300 [Melioribacteraceae bacterium]
MAIAINPVNPDVIAAGANIDYFFLSTDGGDSWNYQELTSSLGVWGDPSLVFDTEGNLYFGHLSNPISGYWIDRIVVQRSTNNGISWNDGAGVGYTYPRNQDKEWLAVDHSNSQFRNNIYMFWTEFDNYGSSSNSDSSRILFSKSTDKGLVWSNPVRISDVGGNCIDEDHTVEGAVPAVGPNGEIYTAWSGPLGIMFDRSFDGGETFGNDIFVTDQPGGWAFNIPSVSRCNGFPITACDISDSPFRGNVYILWSDQRNGTTDTDIFFTKSTDHGDTWSEKIRVNDDNSGRHQFFPWMCVDSTTGAIYSVFYDRRNTTGSGTDVYMAKSTDGGETFENFKISESTFNTTSSVFFGDYINIAAHNRVVRPLWTRMDGFDLSVWTAEYIDSSDVLPAEFGLFSANVEGRTVLLNWVTSSELNNKEFVVQRKLNTEDSEWLNLVTITGAGTTNKENFYSYNDNNVNLGEYSYRIKQIDFDGSFSFSKQIVVEVRIVNSFVLHQNYPNPFNPTTTLGFEIAEDTDIKLEVYDGLGNKISTLFSGRASAGMHEYTFTGDNLASGIYLCKLSSGDKIAIQKMLLLK